MLLSPVPSPNAFFGDDVIAIHNIYNGLSLAIVGEPGRNRVHVYISQGAGLGTTYTLEQTLTVPEAVLPQHRLLFFNCCFASFYYHLPVISVSD